MFTVCATYHLYRPGRSEATVMKLRTSFEDEQEAYRAAAMFALCGASYVDIYDGDMMRLDVVAVVHDEIVCSNREIAGLVDTDESLSFCGRFGAMEV